MPPSPQLPANGISQYRVPHSAVLECCVCPSACSLDAGFRSDPLCPLWALPPSLSFDGVPVCRGFRAFCVLSVFRTDGCRQMPYGPVDGRWKLALPDRDLTWIGHSGYVCWVNCTYTHSYSGCSQRRLGSSRRQLEGVVERFFRVLPRGAFSAKKKRKRQTTRC